MDEVHRCRPGSPIPNEAFHCAGGDLARLGDVLDSAQRHIRSASHLFKLAQDAFRLALLQREAQKAFQSPPPPLLDAALRLGLQVTRLTLASVNWRRREIVRWLVACATECGPGAVLSLLRGWAGLFTPTEATGPVAAAAVSHATAARLGLTFAQQDELAACARTLALQCAREVSGPCRHFFFQLIRISSRPNIF